MKTKIIIFLSFVSLIIFCPFGMAQNRKYPYNENSIDLGHYIIDTVHKTVGYIHQEHISGTHSGYKLSYIIDTLINSQTTCLYIVNNQLVFKERYVPASVQTESVHHKVEGYNYNKGLYEKDGKFYHLRRINPITFVDFEMPKGINFDRLTYVDGNPNGDRDGYLYDKTGLYYLNLFNTIGISKLGFARNCSPVMRKFYCEYNGEAFQGDKKIGRVDQFTEIDMRRDGKTICLTDGKTVFSSYHPRCEIPRMDKWIQLTDGNWVAIENNRAYFPPSKEHNKDSLTYYDVLFASPDSLVLIDCHLQREPRKIDSVFIKQGDSYEPLDMAKYILSANSFYAYRGKNYYDLYQIKNNFDMPNLKWLKGVYGRTGGWLSDGIVLTHRDLFNANEAEFACVPLANAKNLIAVTEKLLFDSINFYQFSSEGNIEVIPIKKIWFDVEVISAAESSK